MVHGARKALSSKPVNSLPPTGDVQRGASRLCARTCRTLCPARSACGKSAAQQPPAAVRPPVPQVRELLSETGEVKALWMPSIKTHCYVVFETKAQAEATRRVRPRATAAAPAPLRRGCGPRLPTAAASAEQRRECMPGGGPDLACSLELPEGPRLSRARHGACPGVLFTRSALPCSLPPPPSLPPVQATYQLQWPATNPKRLAPRFVPLAEAETSERWAACRPDLSAACRPEGCPWPGRVWRACESQQACVRMTRSAREMSFQRFRRRARSRSLHPLVPPQTRRRVAAAPPQPRAPATQPPLRHVPPCAGIGHGAGNPDFRVKRTEEDGEEAAAEPEAEAPAKAASEPREAAKVPDRRCAATLRGGVVQEPGWPVRRTGGERAERVPSPAPPWALSTSLLRWGPVLVARRQDMSGSSARRGAHAA